MKKNFTILMAIITVSSVFAQLGTAPQTISYQAVIRNGLNTLVQNSQVGVKISILQGNVNGSAVYVETHTSQTNQNGLLDLQIGGGKAVSGVFTNGIYWGQSYFLKTEIDPLGSTDYTITSTAEMLSVPVSNYAHVSGTLHGESWKFVGAYKEVNPTYPNGSIEGYCFITYLGVDKVLWTFRYAGFDRNDDGYFDWDEVEPEHSYYGTVLGNVVTFPSQQVYGEEFTEEIIGILNGDTLTISTPVYPEDGVTVLIKQL
ncbi:hypothetical protein ACFSKN_01185 [Mariniflexile gromovii]|uniref:Uncharacterized protein n=1 Tax=Mariniflexile gromovii TaxID=362523 RepID=A0ABS4BSD8_9FLAO|nr:hypothetical protein [Mariniflexile gromovii]MBP0903489.1 hypothetical protein [Mariniflexile gromovii]